MRVTLPDTLLDALEALAAPTHSSVDQVVEALVRRTLHVPVQDRYLLLSGETRQALEVLIGHPVTDAADLVTQVDRLAAIRFGTITLKLSPKQKEEVKRRAGKRGLSVPDLVAEIAAEIEPLFFDRMGGFGIGYQPSLSARAEPRAL